MPRVQNTLKVGKTVSHTQVFAFNRIILVLLNIYISDNTDFILRDKNPLCHYLIFFRPLLSFYKETDYL